MKTLTTLTNEEICKFLLNDKKADALELSPEEPTGEDTSGFTSRVVYEDKHMKIIYSFLEIDKDDVIEQFTIYSTWWGKIKNSMFTLQGFKGKCEKRCGVINLNDLRDWNSGTNHSVNKRNRAAPIDVTDFDSFCKRYQKEFGGNPRYELNMVVSQAPNSWVKIEVILPNGDVYDAEGTSKRDAANRFATAYKW